MIGEALPRDASVDRLEQAAAGPPARPAPRVNLELPHTGEKHARIARVHGDVGAAGVLVNEQRALPALAAVGGAKDAALLLRAVRMPQRAREHDVRIARIDADAADTRGPIEPQMDPRLARVGRKEDADANRDVAADEGVTGSSPDDVRIGRSNRQRTNEQY